MFLKVQACPWSRVIRGIRLNFKKHATRVPYLSRSNGMGDSLQAEMPQNWGSAGPRQFGTGACLVH